MGILRISILIFSFVLMGQSEAQTSHHWYKLIKRHKLNKSKQAYCFRHPNGRIHGRNIDKLMPPASVTKIYVSYYALKKLGAHYRYRTNFHYKEGHLHIEGSQDSHFTSEDLLSILSELGQLGITQVDRLTFDENFYFNWRRPYRGLAGTLKKAINRNSATRFKVRHVYLKNHPRLDGFDFQFQHKSVPLYAQLKKMNIFSNNFIGWNLFHDLGGASRFYSFMKKEYKVDSKTIRIENGAGFRPNLATCRITLYILEDLNRLAAKEGIELDDILSVPGADEGTLGDRFNKEYKKTLVAKTGTLRRASTLAGHLRTEGKFVPFAIFNQTSHHWRAMRVQDDMVKKIFDEVGLPDQFNYARFDLKTKKGTTLWSL